MIIFHYQIVILNYSKNSEIGIDEMKVVSNEVTAGAIQRNAELKKSLYLIHCHSGGVLGIFVELGDKIRFAWLMAIIVN